MAAREVEGVDELYGLDPSEFTAARNALVKQLKADKRKDDAAVVAAIRRPTAPAWALNQVAREEPGLIAAALAAGAQVRDATGDAFRAATAEERVAVAAVVKAAARRLGSSEAPAALAATVHAAEVDDEVADQLRRGVLTTDHQRSGLGFGFGLGDDADGVVVPRTAKAKPAPRTRPLRSVPRIEPPEPEPEPEVDDAVAHAEEVAREAEAAARRDAEAERRRQLVQLTDRVSRARKKATRLTQEAERAEATAAGLRAQADEAAAAVTELEQERAALDG